MRCAQELCEYWNGSGCVCDVLDLSSDERPIVDDQDNAP